MTVSTLTRSFSSIYFSHLMGVKIYTPEGQVYGYLKDLVAFYEERPKIIAGIVKNKSTGQIETLDWDGFNITLEDRKYQVVCKQPKEVSPPNNALLLNKHILDKQIVDVDDKKLVRVNDIRLAFLASGTFPVAVDVGTSGLFRRLGIVEWMSALYELFQKHVPSRLILWSNIELLSQQSRNLKLSVQQNKLNLLHPSDLSDIIEELDAKTATAVFNSLDNEKAADVLEEMEDEAKVSLVEEMPVEKAADVLEKMPTDEVADILGDLQEEKAEELLEEMDHDTSEEVRELMEYPEDTAGSLMSTEFFAFPPDTLVGAVINELRKFKPDPDTIYSIFVIDKSKKLIGEVSLRDIAVSELEIPLSKLMDKNLIFVKDNDSINSLTRLISKYTLLAIPVIDEEKRLLGSIVIDDIIHEIFKNKKVTL